jgi:solute:Na+ symporter, SSS family
VLDHPDQIMMRIAMQSGLPILMGALVAAAALSATIVAGAALTLAATATLSNDLIQEQMHLSDARLKRLMQYLSIAIIGISFLFSIKVESTLQYIMLMAYGLVSQLFPLVLASLYWRRCSAAGAISGLVIGSAVAVFFTIGPYPHPYDVHPGMIGLVANSFVLVIVSLCTSPPKEAVIRPFLMDRTS